MWSLISAADIYHIKYIVSIKPRRFFLNISYGNAFEMTIEIASVNVNILFGVLQILMSRNHTYKEINRNLLTVFYEMSHSKVLHVSFATVLSSKNGSRCRFHWIRSYFIIWRFRLRLVLCLSHIIFQEQWLFPTPIHTHQNLFLRYEGLILNRRIVSYYTYTYVLHCIAQPTS